MVNFFKVIFMLIFCISCLPEQKVRTLNNSQEETSVDTTDDSTGVSFDDEDNTFNFKINWYNSGLNSKTLTVDVDNEKSIYLLGDQVHNFLLTKENYDSTYCIEFRFQKTLTQSPKILRVKALTTYSNNFRIGQSTRFLRVNLNTSSGNSFCNIQSKELVNGQLTTISAGDTDYDGDIDLNDNSYVYDTSSVCNECLNILNASEIILYKNNENETTTTHSDDYLERVALPEVPFNELGFRIDMNSNSSEGGSSCTNSSCIASGFDCCVEGQCINEKNTKPAGIAADEDGFKIAEKEKANNPFWYKKYPQFYYMCLEQVPTDNTGDDGALDPADPQGDATTRLESLINDYNCIEELKTNSLTDPFHTNPVDTTKAYTQCVLDPNTTDNMHYKNVMKRMYQNCGCVEKTDYDKMVNFCPAYTYKPVYLTDQFGNQTSTISAVTCVTPAPSQTPLPFSDLEVQVNSKSAPHRFFDDLGFEITPAAVLPTGASGVQEGEKFEYLDEYFIFPRNKSFNMNSILGEFNVSLTQAHPAKVIDLEFDKKYFISTQSGFFSQCPDCAKDSWFGSFSQMPTANRGVGLQAVGFTTSRNTYGTNTTLGSYEDTHFGRACWVPPTMIPFSQEENADVISQRKNRLQAQAAMYINGYQRDWFGFNKGALIGSFDGVTWFAIGKGRIVTATSNKLFLAINAPFADLTTPTTHMVSVQEYDFVSSAPQFDYTPGLEINDAFQNEAGSCQKYHECNTDSHCISKLGWEYVCADVTTMKTKWPQFSSLGSTEVASTSYTGTIVDFLQQKQLPPNSDTKRCVYRGAGAPCRTDYGTITDEGIRKSLTCAPNFYCASLASTNFNDEVARFGRPLQELVESKNHLYGMDANILGRPKDYITTGGGSALPGSVQTTIENNILLTDTSATGKVGICRPGKALPNYATSISTTDNNQYPTNQHQSADANYRTDYISQVGSCNSALFTDRRYSSCPILDTDGNYITTKEDFINAVNADTTSVLDNALRDLAGAQNTCGLETLKPGFTLTTTTTADELQSYSAFKTIEGLPLSTSNVIIEPSLSRDACFRKPGSVCHTNLDCSPNKLMADVIDLVGEDYYGNDAEKKYFEEYLVCSQAQPEPRVGNYNFNSYTMHNNRCCREVGKELTMYTEDTPNVEETTSIESDKFAATNPGAADRYSRYQTEGQTMARVSADTTNAGAAPDDKTLDNPTNITNSNQWKTIHNTGAKTCCGGSWVRKFADGTNDWSKPRLSLEVSNFQCLNYKSPLVLANSATLGDLNLTVDEVGADLSNFCVDPSLVNGGCVENNFSIGKGAFETNTLPIVNTYTGTMKINTDPALMDGQWTSMLWSFHMLLSQNGNIEDLLVMDWSSEEEELAERTVIKTRLPAFIDDTNLTIRLEDHSNPNTFVAASVGVWTDNSARWNGAGDCVTDYCYEYNPTTRSLIIGYSDTVTTNPLSYGNELDVFSAEIEWTAPGTLAWEQANIAAAIPNANETVLSHRRSSTPGSEYYYLQRLSRLEYLGIPQMTYEPVYCNDNYQKLVPGIFLEEIQTVNQFLNSDKTFIDSNTSKTWATDTGVADQFNIETVEATLTGSLNLNHNLATTQELVDHAPIFSDSKFLCCQELGTPTRQPSMCCSGSAIEIDRPLTPDGRDRDNRDGWYECALPKGTNLYVYFNKFVSGEGMSTTYFDTALETDDFNARTGEPLQSDSVQDKVKLLGERFCETKKVRRGAAFGNYQAKPLGPLRALNQDVTNYTIIDSIFDNGNINNVQVGYPIFREGLYWNNHLYCDLTE